MANTVPNLSYANTFGEWVTATSALIGENNRLATSDYTKDSGTLFLNETTQNSLQANGSVVIQKQLSVQGTGSSASIQNNLGVGGLLTLSNASYSLSAAGQANIAGPVYATGSGTGLTVANNVVIGRNTNIGGNTTITYNTVTDTIQSNTSVNTTTLSVTGDIYTKTLQSNSSVNTSNASIVNTVYTKYLQANNSVNTSTVNASSIYTNTTQTNTLQANTSANTQTLSVTQTGYLNLVQANSAINTAISSVTQTAYAKVVQANTSANTETLSVTQTSYAKVVQANTSANTETLSVTQTAFVKTLQANTSTNTETLFVTQTGYVNTVQANTLINTTNMWATTNVTANVLVANNYIRTPDVYSTNVSVTGALGGTAAILTSNSAQIGTGGLSVQGNFTVNGSTVYNTNQFVISALTPNQISYFGVYRNTTNAFIRWNETEKYWDVNDVNNTDVLTTYSKLLTANLISDSVTSTSSSTLASSKAANTLNSSITSANTSLKSYVDTTYSNATNISSGTLDAARLATSGAVAGTYGGTAKVPVIIVDNKGRVTSIANTDVAGVAGFGYTLSNSTFTIATSAGTFFNASITDFTISGNLIVNGTTTTVNTSTVVTTDSLIKLANNNIVGDTLDIGFYGQANTGSSVTYTGLVRKAGGNYFLFKGITSDPTSNSLPAGSITLANTATIQANVTGGIVSGLGAAIAIADGGTNNTTFTSGQRLIYDGTRLVSQANTTNTVTGGLSTANTISSFTINAYGEVTAYTGAAIAIASSQVSGLANSATTDTSNATNISSGTLASARLATSGVTAATYGSASSVAQVTVDDKGRVTSANSVSIAISSSAVSGLATSATTDTTSATNISSGTLAAARLATSGVTAGTHGSSINIPVFVVDDKGRVTSVANTAVRTGSTSQTGVLQLTDSTSSTSTTTAATPNSVKSAYDLATSAYNAIPGSSSNPQFNSLGVGVAASGTTGEIRATGDITAGYSDDRLKDKLGNIDNALDKVTQLNGFYYRPNETAQDLGFENKLQVGVSAQEVFNVLPEVVKQAPIDPIYLTVDYEKLVPLLIEAIKELKAEIDQLKGK